MTDYPCICILSVGKLKPKYFQYNWNTERTWANCFQKLKFLSIKLWLLENHYANSSLIPFQIIRNDIQCIFWNSSNGITELRADETKTTTTKNEKFAISANIQIQIGVVKHALSTVFDHFKANQFVICASVCAWSCNDSFYDNMQKPKRMHTIFRWQKPNKFIWKWALSSKLSAKNSIKNGLIRNDQMHYALHHWIYQCPTKCIHSHINWIKQSFSLSIEFWATSLEAGFEWL